MSSVSVCLDLATFGVFAAVCWCRVDIEKNQFLVCVGLV